MDILIWLVLQDVAPFLLDPILHPLMICSMVLLLITSLVTLTTLDPLTPADPLMKEIGPRMVLFTAPQAPTFMPPGQKMTENSLILTPVMIVADTLVQINPLLNPKSI